MKQRYLWLLFFSFSPLLIAAQPSIEKQQIDLSAAFKDLEELGYCVIPQLLSVAETKQLYTRVWQEYIEKAWPNCKMNDRSNWKESFPIHQKTGIFAGPAGQIQVMWDLRQDPRMIDVFAQLWNTRDLIVSMDGLSLMCPVEIRKGCEDPWPHVDQGIFKKQDGTRYNNSPPADFVSESSLSTKPFTIQGQFLFEDSFAGDGGFYCIPKSHLRFTEFAPELEMISHLPISRDEARAVRTNYLSDFFTKAPDPAGEPYQAKQITAPRGSLILWDSRTIHWNQHASEDRPASDLPKVRMVGYLCYVPKARLSEEDYLIRKKAFDSGVSTGHNPAHPELKWSKDHIKPEFKQYLEDANYVQPTIQLTPLGKSLIEK